MTSVSSPPETLDEVIEQAGWQFASSMPTIPHEYIVRETRTGGRDPLPAEWHDWLAEQIDRDGYDAEFAGRSYRYLIHRGFKYWVIGPVINRERIKEEAE